MRILLPTGKVTYTIVQEAAKGFDADVVVTGELASFLTPGQVRSLLSSDASYDLVLVSGMCTASFADVEQETGIPIYRGPRHAADIGLVLPLIGKIELSRDIPADEFLSGERRKEALARISRKEAERAPTFALRGVKIGGGTRIKVLAEIMDAHRTPDLRTKVLKFFEEGADIVDLGFGFDATPDDVRAVFRLLEGIEGPLAVDTQDPALIEASLNRADLILSLQEENIPRIGEKVAEAGCGAVIVPGEAGLLSNIRLAEASGITRVIADPVLQPCGSGLVQSLAGFTKPGCPLFFGAGNVIELCDADSVGMCALLAGMAYETGASLIFCSEHSDKTTGCIAEMRIATDMMALMDGRPYPKDLGIDLFRIKEKRRRREPPLEYTEMIQASPMPREITYDPRGNYRIGIEDGYIVAVRNGKAIKGTKWQDVLFTILQTDGVSLFDHAGYLGAELFKAELAIRFQRSFEQDGPF
ncbi:dihydropteroate synthase-like protein [Methanospirillum hungatei]|uniref:dihydropteroate synthase-like protein n=1 Tax=Methanospirillum hungatei TaxID=2203 RepID=UPI001B68F6DA|nr:dihydropteroate synthase-like protein [Methanospirillum hungatei]MBP7034909.1 dihydropteroate synthase-like protein [Methanospirillum sp.]HOW04519.1 dihydropteroate synthase-like protein [Methanospirillum hungatei]